MKPLQPFHWGSEENLTANFRGLKWDYFYRQINQEKKHDLYTCTRPSSELYIFKSCLYVLWRRSKPVPSPVFKIVRVREKHSSSTGRYFKCKPHLIKCARNKTYFRWRVHFNELSKMIWIELKLTWIANIILELKRNYHRHLIRWKEL